MKVFKLDRAAAVTVLVELASRMTVDELFETLTQIAVRLGERIDLTDLARRPETDSELTDCLRTCLSAHGLV